MRSIQLKFCRIQMAESLITTHFADGKTCPATPHMTPHYHVVAHRCGYGDDLMAYCLEHEFCHCLVEERFHDRPSRVLWGLAHGQPLTGPDAAYEEIAAQTLQRWLRANERPILSGVQWDDLKRDALALLDETPRTPVGPKRRALVPTWLSALAEMIRRDPAVHSHDGI